jgi:nucleoprotein TPR
MERATALAGQLSTVMAARDAHEHTIKSLQASSSQNEEEVAALRATTDDLSRQVQGLLRQLAIRDDPSLANSPMDGPAPVEGDLITDHLLEFRSIRGLQEQNHKLLKMTRGLMAKLDAQEINRATSDTDDLDTAATLEQATQTINRLHAQLLEAQKKINEAVKERDFFSKLLAKGEGLNWSPSGTGDGDSPHQQTIVSLQAEMDTVRSKAEEEIKEIRDQLRAKAEAAGVAEVERAKADAKATLLEGKLSLPDDRWDGADGQNNIVSSPTLTRFRSRNTVISINSTDNYRVQSIKLRMSVNPYVPFVLVLSILTIRRSSRLQANKRKLTDYVRTLPPFERRKNSGR